MENTHETKFLAHKNIWEQNATSNAMWAVLSDPSRLEGGFLKDEFYSSGKHQVEDILDRVRNLIPEFKTDGIALDFGCGLGRLTVALRQHFPEAIGLDVSQEMIDQAKFHNQEGLACTFKVNQKPNLDQIEDKSLSFILSLIVIQHIPKPYSETYLAEFTKKLKPGGVLVVQVPSHRKATPRNIIRKLIPEKFSRWKHNWMKKGVPYVTMYGLSEAEVTRIFTNGNLELLEKRQDSSAGDDWESLTYIARKKID